MTRRFDLVLFDLDGTLIETAPEIADAVNDTLAAVGKASVTQQQVNDWIGHGTRELLIQALAWCDGTSSNAVRHSADFSGIEAVFARHYLARCGTRSHLYPQVRETLTELRAQGVKLAVVTNKEDRYTRTVLDAHRLMPMLDRVISGDTLPVKKPDPAAIHHCLREFNVAPERALFVGDSSIDVATARNGGIAVWALPYGYNMGSPIEASSPDRVIADVSALTG
ncbi:phosphoglycolate phosphatase [Hydrogenophaga sp. R2]|uniref:phosphoglycolate phosphatase n=1 Tax=Hydrogenophaga sp. R2 TaxID=3132827 RepID=UPI003CF9502D